MLQSYTGDDDDDDGDDENNALQFSLFVNVLVEQQKCQLHGQYKWTDKQTTTNKIKKEPQRATNRSSGALTLTRRYVIEE